MLLRDVVFTRDEVDGLTAGLLTSAGTPSCRGAMGGLPPRWLPETLHHEFRLLKGYIPFP